MWRHSLLALILVGSSLFAQTTIDAATRVKNWPNSPVEQKENCLVSSGLDDGIRYVSANGNDSNTGCSWDAAKLTWMAAYDSLPSGGGTIYGACDQAASYCPAATSSGANCICIMGPSDRNYSSPPVGWRKAKNGAVSFVGAVAYVAPQNSTAEGTTSVRAGSSTVSGFWLSGVSGVTFRNLNFQYPVQVGRIGIDSNGNRTDSSASDILLWNVTGSDYNSPGSSSFGPALDVGANVLWLRVENSYFTGNPAAAANTANRYAINIDSGGSSYPCSGQIYIENTHYVGGGGLRFNSACNGATSFVVKNTLMEGVGQSTPVVDVVGTGAAWQGYAESQYCSDSGDTPPTVRVAQGNPPSYMTVVNTVGCGGFVVEGPATIRNNSGIAVGSRGDDVAGQELAVVSPLAKNQQGDYLGRSLFQSDAARRLFQPSLIRFANNLQGSTQLPSTWTAGSGKITTGIQAPDGTTNAATVDGNTYVFGTSGNFNAGDYVYVGVWAQQASTAGFSGLTTYPLYLEFPFGCGPGWQIINGSAGSLGANSGSSGLEASPYYQNDGNWQWLWVLAKVTSPVLSCGFRLYLNGASASPVNYFAPIYVQVPALSVALVAAPTFSSASESGNTVTMNTTLTHHLSVGEPLVISGCSVSGYNGAIAISTLPTRSSFTYYASTTGMGPPSGCVITPGNDSEMADWAFNAATYSDSCVVGTICGLRGQTLTEPAFGTLTNCHVNSTSSAACGSATSGSFVVSTGTTNYIVDTTAVTAHSRIFIVPVTDASDLPSRPTCNAPAPGYFGESSRAAGKSFTFTLPKTSGTTCWNYWIVN